MTNPVSSLTHRTTLLLVLAIFNAIIIGVMQSFGSSLKPFSIIAFEFSWTPEQAHLIVDTWHKNGVLDSVFFLTGFDYLFMITYSTFMWLACMHLAVGASHKLSNTFIVLAWLQPLAALLDALENLALYQIISGSWKPLWPVLAASCAMPKFLLVILGILSCGTISVYKIARKGVHQKTIEP